MIWWEEEIQKCFPELEIDDISDFDRTQSKTFLISLYRGQPVLSSEDFEEYVEKTHIYYMEINISEDEDKAFLNFLKYVKGGNGQGLIVSENIFLPQHEEIRRQGEKFIRERGLRFLSFEDLAKPVKMDGKIVSLYYRDFTQVDENPMYSPKEEHYKTK